MSLYKLDEDEWFDEFIGCDGRIIGGDLLFDQPNQLGIGLLLHLRDENAGEQFIKIALTKTQTFDLVELLTKKLGDLSLEERS